MPDTTQYAKILSSWCTWKIENGQKSYIIIILYHREFNAFELFA